MLYEAMLIAIVLGILTKGNLKNLGQLDMKYIMFIFISFLLKYGIDYLALHGYKFSLFTVYLVQITAYLLLFVFLYINREIPGMGIMFVGMFLNFIVIMVNKGTMPVKLEGLDPSIANTLLNNTYPTHSIFMIDTKLPYLADIFLQKYPKPKMFSIGDVFISIGVFYLVWATMHAKNKVKSYRLESFLSRPRV